MGKRKKGLYRPGWHNLHPFDARTPIEVQRSLWVRRDGEAFTLGPGSGHVDQAVQVSGIMDDDSAFNALFHAGEARAFLSRSGTGAHAECGVSFVGVPTPAQVRALGEINRANGGAQFHWAQYDTADKRLAMGHDWRSFVAMANAPRENPKRGEMPGGAEFVYPDGHVEHAHAEHSGDFDGLRGLWDHIRETRAIRFRRAAASVNIRGVTATAYIGIVDGNEHPTDAQLSTLARLVTDDGVNVSWHRHGSEYDFGTEMLEYPKGAQVRGAVARAARALALSAPLANPPRMWRR